MIIWKQINFKQIQLENAAWVNLRLIYLSETWFSVNPYSVYWLFKFMHHVVKEFGTEIKINIFLRHLLLEARAPYFYSYFMLNFEF